MNRERERDVIISKMLGAPRRGPRGRAQGGS